MNKGVIYQGNSIISIETLPDYAQPVVIKKPAKHHPSRRYILSLEKEYEMEGETLRDTIARKTLNLRSGLEIALDLARILANIHQQNVIHLDLNSKNIFIGNEQRAIYIIGLGSAAHIDRSGQQKVRPDQLLGTPIPCRVDRENR
jgi:tRNA A-37 threonylcarbamoyl transferase component Bud32